MGPAATKMALSAACKDEIKDYMTKRSMREEYGKSLIQIGKKFSSIVVLEADLKDSTQSIQFQKEFPERYFDVGVAEQNMVGMAAGLALEGKIPLVHSFACFLSMRALEQVRTSIAYPNLNVKIIASHGGISAGTAGATHHSIEDLAIMRAIPRMTVLAPGDIVEMKQALREALEIHGPVYLRLTAGEVDCVFDKAHKFKIGKANWLRHGKDLTIITTGVMMHQALKAADILLKTHGIKAGVLQMASVKPMDKRSIVKAAHETKLIVTVEEHNVIGGLGGAVCEIASEVGGAIVWRMGIQDTFCGTGTESHLKEKENLSATGIVNTCLRANSKRKSKI